MSCLQSSPDFQNTVRLFRLNSFVKDRGQKEDVDAEPERQQWDDPMEFLMSCISMSVGESSASQPKGGFKMKFVLDDKWINFGDIFGVFLS